MDWDEHKALLALNGVPGLGPERIRFLAGEAGSAVEVVRSPAFWNGRLPTHPLPPREDDLWSLACGEEDSLRRTGARAVCWCDPGFPPALRHLDHPPPVLTVLGALEPLQDERLRIAIVGARACTPYGRAQAARFGSLLAGAGVGIVSGAARGIDQAAMAGAVDQSGAVVGILGSGLDRPYPPEARRLLSAMLACGGTVLSEFPSGTPPRRGNFPRRNRLLAALVRGVLVVQATEKSGSMLTVGWALNLGRDVFALPGPVDCIASRGPHKLLSEGAILADSPASILAHYRTPMPEAPGGPEEPPLLRLLAGGSRTLEDLSAASGEPAEKVLLELVELELSGRVLRLPGGLYHRCGPGPASRPVSPFPA
ncbi:MAG: DNA-processing protein DprA [Planctomycetota bacterium]